MRLLLAGLLSLPFAMAQAQTRWMPYARNAELLASIDTTRTRNLGPDRWSVWVRLDYTRDRPASIPDTAIAMTVLREEVDCKNERIIIRDLYNYNRTDSLLVSGGREPFVKWQDVPPGTAYEVLMRFVCSRRKHPPS